jgi:predicted dienelactone hydrolase
VARVAADVESDVNLRPRFGRSLATALLLVAGAMASAATGTMALPGAGDGEPITVFYPTDAPAARLHFGPGVSADLAGDATPRRGNGRLVIVSHGSGGSPWVHTELIATLVEAGFIVAAPWHREDNHRDPARPGPDSWERRPAEVSRAIDAVLAEPRLAGLVDGDRVGVYGMSAGGHTALSMAGGRWSPARLRDHCEAHLAEDFAFCSGLNLQLTGGALDGLKQWVVRQVIRWRFGDDTPREHHDPRVAAVVAAVPVAADFDMASLARPRVPLALATARRDAWLVPQFHSARVLETCAGCEHLVDLDSGGHGAYLGPLPQRYSGQLAQLLNDPPGFDRGLVPAVNQAISAFFVRQLIGRPAGADDPR